MAAFPAQRRSRIRRVYQRALAGVRRATPLAVAAVFLAGGETLWVLGKPHAADDTSRLFQMELVLGLPVVIFVTYFALVVAGYRVGPGGNSNAPRPLAWLIVAGAILLVFGPIFYFGGS